MCVLNPLWTADSSSTNNTDSLTGPTEGLPHLMNWK